MINKVVKAGVIIKRSKKYLLVKEASKRALGLWNFPSGTVKSNEIINRAALREAKEETGFTLKLKRDVYLCENTFPDTFLMYLFKASIVKKNQLKTSKEIICTRWFSYLQVKKMQDELVGKWVLETLEKVEANNNLCSFSFF